MTEAKSLEEALAEAFTTADSLDAPLDRKLQFYLGESRKLLPDLEATYDQLVARIQANGADILVPAIGERLPEFLMTDSDGHLVDLASLVSKGPLMISLQPRAVVRLLRAGAACARGGEVVSIVPETAKYARPCSRVLTDLDLADALRSAWSSGWATKSSRPTANSASILNNFKVMAGGCCPSPRRW